MEQELIEKFYQSNKKLYEEARNPLKCHGPDHHRRVCLITLDLARKIAEREGIKADREALIAASFLHDLAAFYPEETGEDYHGKDYDLARQAFKKIDFPEEKKEKALEAIKYHGSDPKYKQENESIEVKILRDADKLEAFGPLGVARIIMARTRRGDTLNKIVDDYYIKGHLQRKWNSITTDEAKQIGRESYKYALDFFAQLHKSLKKS